uniref:MATH domain-containing protein n=1 Tax=Nelumbo nucifera TaxID=4432 RepID=A0A822Y4J9_NELNU|nr:TPA_asm: hypothetical protein HUJ06_028928 [Nelumbo nucifera]
MTKRGFTHLISLETFNDPSNGYLVEDTCYFGAEVFVSKNHGEGECLSMTKGPVSCSHTWKIEKFSLLCEKQYSKEFSVADFPWKILLYPRGDSKEKDRSLSFISGPCLRVKDQIRDIHWDHQAKRWFDKTGYSWGWAEFMPLSSLKDKSKGFLVNDLCIVEAHIQFIGVVNNLS